jgi:hypothetical protein
MQLHFPTSFFPLGKYKPILQIGYPVFKHPLYAHAVYVIVQVLTSVDFYVHILKMQHCKISDT